MMDQPSSDERGVYNRAGWVAVSTVLGLLFLFSSVCAMTPTGTNIIDGLRSRLNITTSLTSNSQPPTPTNDGNIPVVFNSSATPGDTPTELAQPTDQPAQPTDRPDKPTATKRPTATVRPTDTPTRKPTLADLPTPTKAPTDRPTPTTGNIATATPKPAVTTVLTAVATAIATVPSADCHCQGVDKVCNDGTVSYNSAACGGTGQCVCRNGKKVCPDGSVTDSPDCMP